jgi:hypothetical protein
MQSESEPQETPVLSLHFVPLQVAVAQQKAFVLLQFVLRQSAWAKPAQPRRIAETANALLAIRLLALVIGSSIEVTVDPRQRIPRGGSRRAAKPSN